MKDVSSALKYALNKGFQIHPDAYKILESLDIERLEKVIREIVRGKTSQKQFLINQEDLESYLGIKEEKGISIECKILYDITNKVSSAEGVSGFGSLFTSRFEKLKRIMSNRPEFRMIKSISSVVTSKSKDELYVCGLVNERLVERNIVKLILEDQSGQMEIIVFDEELKKVAETLFLDQFIMVRIIQGKNGGYICKDITLPDIPDHAGNRLDTEVYAAFLSDLHIGSKYFMEEELIEFISWLSSPDPIARKVRFILIDGDVLDGIGIYPNQDKELLYKTTEAQLEKLEKILDKIPNNIRIIICPGNHDPGRRALPQPAIPKYYNAKLWERENLMMVSNPSVVSLGGVKVLMFHGQSIDDIVKTTAGLSYDKPSNVMKNLLKARHLSPIYGSQTPLAPEIEDMMVVDDVPDIFHVGHVHVVDLDIYKGILLINSGTWQKQTPFQASVGINPTSGIAVLVNLQTFKVYTKDFSI